MNKARKKTVLIVDDNDGIIASLTMVLQYGGYKVTSTMDGTLAKNIKSPFPDLILLDIWMTGVNGLEICKFLKEKEETKHIPIIMISAYPDSRAVALQAGANDFIEKPYTMADLLASVEKYLSREVFIPVMT